MLEFSLVPRLSPGMTTMNSTVRRGRAWYPFARDATEQTSRIYQLVSLDVTHMQTVIIVISNRIATINCVFILTYHFAPLLQERGRLW